MPDKPPQFTTAMRQQEDEEQQRQGQKEGDQLQGEETAMSKWGSRLGWGASFAFLLGKGKNLLVILKLGKFMPLASMTLTAGLYSTVFGLPYAVGMVGLILVHEAGHALEMHRQGIPFGPMVFIPFLGASVEMKEMPKNAYGEALVALAGPVLGSVGAVAVAIAGVGMDSQLLLALGNFGLMVNLFNLLPIHPMDGGRVVGALNKWFLVGGLGIGAYAVLTGSISHPIMPLFLLLSCFSTYKRFTEEDDPSYHNMSGGQRGVIASSYLALMAILFFFSAVVKKLLRSLKELQQEAGVEESKVLAYLEDPAFSQEEDDWALQSAEDREREYRDAMSRRRDEEAEFARRRRERE